MATYSFNEEAIANAIDAAKKTHEQNQLNAKETNLSISSEGCSLIAGGCISVTTEDHKVCLNLPLRIGKYCFSLPVSIPNGTVGEACIHICTTWGIPTGVKVTVSIAGKTIVTKSFGKC